MSKDQDNAAAAAALDALLDQNLSDVADLPEYLDNCPNGFYHLKMEQVERKMVEIKGEGGAKVPAPVVQFVYSIVAALELEDQTKEPPKPNSRFNETVFFHKDAQKANEVIKSKFKGLAESQGWNTVADIVNGLKGLEFGAIVKSKADRDKEDKWYIQVTNARPI